MTVSSVLQQSERLEPAWLLTAICSNQPLVLTMAKLEALPADSPADVPSASTGRAALPTDDAPGRKLDILKSIVWAVLLICLLGKFVTDSPVWGYEAELRRAWTDHVVRPKMIELNARQLRRFDGSDPDRPIYVAVSGAVYDVTPSRRIYGPGGSYHTLAGKDASRAFVTGCFQPHHLTHDLRGLTGEELVGLTNWEKFFASSKKYTLVGHVSLPAIDPSTPPPGPCEVGKFGGAPGGEGKGAKPVDGAGQGQPRQEL